MPDAPGIQLSIRYKSTEVVFARSILLRIFGDDHSSARSNLLPKGEGHSQELLLFAGELGALSDLDNIAVRIADVAARLALFGYWFCDELRSATFP